MDTLLEQPSYQPPDGATSAVTSPAPPVTAELAVGARTFELLSQTRPWVLFLSIFGFVIAGLMLVFGALGTLGLMVAGDPAAIVALLVYMPFGGVYLLGSLFLFRYARGIAALLQFGRPEHFDDALAAQKSFWKFAGITVLVMVVLWMLILFFAVATGVMAGVMSASAAGG